MAPVRAPAFDHRRGGCKGGLISNGWRRFSSPFVALSALFLAGLLGVAGACSSDPQAAPAPIEDASPAPIADAGPLAEVDAADAAPPDVPPPALLVAALLGKTYVEGSCVPTTYPGWPYDAQKCTYRDGGLEVTIANPTSDRVARWIVDASEQIDALAALKTTDPAGWEEGLVVIAKHAIGQSSRIFPLAGKVYENGTAYTFERGVTKTCKTGCYCRINSTSRPQWCKYRAEVLDAGDEQACMTETGQTSSTLTEPWLAHCLANHVAAWTSRSNAHYRAQAWSANVDVKAALADAGQPTKDQVIAALKSAYPGF